MLTYVSWPLSWALGRRLEILRLPCGTRVWASVARAGGARAAPPIFQSINNVVHVLLNEIYMRTSTCILTSAWHLCASQTNVSAGVPAGSPALAPRVLTPWSSFASTMPAARLSITSRTHSTSSTTSCNFSTVSLWGAFENVQCYNMRVWTKKCVMCSRIRKIS